MKLHFTRAFSTKVDASPNVVDCASMFGIGIDEDIEISLYKDLPVEVGAGRIIYITGESGAGKSCLLRDIASKAGAADGFRLIRDADIDTSDARALVDQFGDWSIQSIGELLSYVGIAEAFVYLRKPRELSDGQRYRFKLARMIYEAVKAEGSVPVICIDEYLAFLDRETARNVAYQTRRAATKHGLCMVLATTHSDIAEELQPDLTITMRLNIPPELKETAL